MDSSSSSSPPSSSSATAEPQPDGEAKREEREKEMVHRTKVVQFLGRTTPIILQNDNGPCPLLAICNVLSLKNSLNLSPDIPEVLQEKLLSLVAERLIDSNSNIENKDTGYVENQQQNIADAIDLLPRLTTGIDVNIKFRRIDDFEFTRECAIFDLLDIPLYHGWIVDPQDHETADAIGSKSYNSLMGELVSLDTQTLEIDDKNNQEGDSVDFVAATTATLGVPSPCLSRGQSFDDSPHRAKKRDIEEEAELLRVLKLSEGESSYPPVGCVVADVNFHEIAQINKTELDGVDVLSISIGGFSFGFYDDDMALGAFSAMEKGILVSCSAGNGGPSIISVHNSAPWILTVGASTTDRKIRATAVLGNKEQFDGESAFQPTDFPPTPLPLVYASTVNESDPSARYCDPESLNTTSLLKGKMVVCDLGLVAATEKGEAVKNAGGIAMIVVNNARYANTTLSEAHVLPATRVSYADGLKIKTYINSTSTPTATILFKGTMYGDDRAPVVAAFSARGPNFQSRGILKPDILGPGVNILAAWHTSVENSTNTKSAFNIISGTSMSCPHLSGVAALLKSSHPDWSPAAIKSAIMTTADVVNLAKNPIEDETFLPADIFATGSGHVNPPRANDPGLIYDIQPKDYIPYLCGLNYTNRQVGVILQSKVDCLVESSIPEAQLNYPSFSVTFRSFNSTPQTYSRMVTNVGEPNSSYVVKIVPPPGVEVHVEPAKLDFSELNQKLQYQVTFTRLNMTSANITFVQQGFLKWSSTRYSVRSPIAVMVGL